MWQQTKNIEKVKGEKNSGKAKDQWIQNFQISPGRKLEFWRNK